MNTFGKLIDDIRKEIKYINISFEEVPFGEIMTIKIPNKPNRMIVINSKLINNKDYTDILETSIKTLKLF